MSYRRMAMNGFLDDVRDWVFDEEEILGTDNGDITYKEKTPGAADRDMPTTLEPPIGTRIFTACSADSAPGARKETDPGCIAVGYTRVPVSAQFPKGWANDVWTGGPNAGNTLTAGDNPVSTFLRDLFGGGSSTPTPNALPATTGPLPSGSTVVAVPGGGTVVVPAGAPPGPSPVAIAFAAACVLGAGYAAYKYL